MLAPIPPPPPSQRSVIIKKPRSLARRLTQEAGSGPLPVFALRIQDRARATANDFLREHGYREHRLYVLEIAGHTPRIKIGYSSAPWERLTRHIGEVNRWQHTLIQAHFSDALPDKATAKSAEQQAHAFMSKFYDCVPGSPEMFVGSDFRAGKTCVETAVACALCGRSEQLSRSVDR
ncbi:hypothetical protein ACKI1I_27985 [Streptomyces turgidiscabies]|uniref:hypothetical protein n=1 Tax=Streptomyces turgidiscabies TaxID=85558 RepID=UPI0038F69733